MFKSSIGPSTAAPIYLRPETAQGQFLNFRKLLDYNNNSMPFASASVGKSYRNEISPRAGLLRVREFMMAEIEHFIDPLGGKRHARFSEVQHVELDLLDRDTQLAGQSDVRRITIGEAVESKTVDNETLGYFLARTYLFLLKIGIDKTRLRFRQHMATKWHIMLATAGMPSYSQAMVGLNVSAVPIEVLTISRYIPNAPVISW